MRALLLAIGVAVCVVAGVAIVRSQHSAPAVVQSPAPRPTAFTVQGWTYECADVVQAVQSGENYTADGHYVYAILLMDCGI